MFKNKILATTLMLAAMAAPGAILFGDIQPNDCPLTGGVNAACDAQTVVNAVVQSSSSRLVPSTVTFPTIVPYITTGDVVAEPFTVQFRYDDYFSNVIRLTTTTGAFQLNQVNGTGYINFSVESDKTASGTPDTPTAIAYNDPIISNPGTTVTHVLVTDSRVLTLTMLEADADADGGYNLAPVGNYTTSLIYTHTAT